ncbi:hypothetical protein MSBR3_1310 [Methanosarcina barkeri 3]|uniref:Uncharacterized protein n=1 Tax=Methanosarcina barkeri 3 TaxID=1434107 RepID=A0A0E3SM32_METBA|nr:hypothetical protein [Methanosarcina barkeri]AKB81888.1 hypothetical protein MSBR3_1310 [Methanosarcina barkeri 3]
MRKKNLLLILMFFVLIIVSIFVHGIYRDQVDWRDDGQRYLCIYTVEVTGLSGREVQGTTVIMVPIPASKEGKFFTPPAQTDIYFSQKLTHKVFNWSDQSGKGPYFENATEIFDNQREIIGNWIPFIAETEKGYMLGFRTNETKLEDIDYITSFVADRFDVFDPINNGSPLLFPVENASNTSSVPYGKYTKYASYPTYNTYVYLSDNLKEGENISFNIRLNANNDPTKWPREYVGLYKNLLLARVNDTGYVKVRAILGQRLPLQQITIPDDDVADSQYTRDFYSNETSDNINATPSYTVVT